MHPNFNTDIVGIGTTTSTSVLAVDGNPSSTGNVFSTDGLGSVQQTWTMNKGGALYGQVGTYLTGYFGLFTPNQSNKSIVFHPNSTGRMIILGSSGSDDGYVGLGRYGLFTPTSQLHQFEPDNINSFHQFTNEYCHSANSATPHDGLKIGIAYNGSTTEMEAEFHQYKDAPMKFFTGNYNATPSSLHFERMRIMQTVEIGINTTTPNSTIEIDGDPAVSDITATGLRFTQVANSSSINTFSQAFNATTISPWGKVLTVDEQGDVGLTEDGGVTSADNGVTIDPGNSRNVQLGHAAFTGSGANLLHDSEIPMDNSNLYFSDDYFGTIDGTKNSICLGTGAVMGKFTISRNLSTDNPVPNATAIHVENVDESEDGNSTGIDNITYGRNGFNIGVHSDVYEAETNYGGYFSAYRPAQLNVGGMFHAENATYNYAVFGTIPSFVEDEGDQFAAAIYGFADPASGNFSGSGSPESYAGYFNGDLAYTGAFGLASDSTIKTNIQPFSNAGSILQQIHCYTYNYDSTKYGDHINLPKRCNMECLHNKLS